MFKNFISASATIAITLWYDFWTRFLRIFMPTKLGHWVKKTTKRVPQWFFILMRSYYGFTFKFDANNFELPKQFLLLANHQSLLDIPIVFYWFNEFNIRFVSKKELGRWIPLVSQVLRYQGHCLIDRKGKRMESMQALEDFTRRSVKNKTSIAIFPEGTRSKDGSVYTFLSGGVRKILEIAPMPVVAFAMDGGWRIGNAKTLFKNMRKGSYNMKILQVYDAPQGKTEVQNILEESQTLIQEQLQAWRA